MLLEHTHREAADFVEHYALKSNGDKKKRAKSAINLATLLLKISQKQESEEEQKLNMELGALFNDPLGQAFTVALQDQCFRSLDEDRIANQITFLIEKFGVPKFLDFTSRLEIFAFKFLGESFSHQLIPFVQEFIRAKTAKVVISCEGDTLEKHIQERREGKVTSNVNRLGEAILGEAEVEKRVKLYLSDLVNNNINYISIKASTLYSQTHPITHSLSRDRMAKNLRRLYLVALDEQAQGKQKFINLDMEEFSDLDITVDLFTSVLNEDEFLKLHAGIALQAYLPDSYQKLEQLINFAKERCARGGAPLRLRLVKGANLEMEKFEAAVTDWPAAPFTSKLQVDAHFKKMLHLSLDAKNAPYLNTGIASHNLFDISYALLLIAENQVADFCQFEMLEGMAPALQRTLTELMGSMTLYCPTATKADFHNAIAYLIRRLDEQSSPENFLRHSFAMSPNSEAFQSESQKFLQAVQLIDEVDSSSRRLSKRKKLKIELDSSFKNEADSDWTSKANRIALQKAQDETEWPECLDLFIAGQNWPSNKFFTATSPNDQENFYQIPLANAEAIEVGLACAAQLSTEQDPRVGFTQRAEKIMRAAELMQENRMHLIQCMMRDVGKSPLQADNEVSEAIDFCNYYCQEMHNWLAKSTVIWRSKGPCLITPPWNFPVAITTGGIVASLITGNPCILKPALEAALCSHELVKIFYQAGFTSLELQCIYCLDEPFGSQLIRDPRIKTVVLTGATETAKKFLEMRPDIELLAETGGKNYTIISSISDHDLAIKNLIQSAFAFSGQKCSATSVALIEKNLYDDPKFIQQIKDACESLNIGSSTQWENYITPMVSPPTEKVLYSIANLAPGEQWLVTPRLDKNNSQLLSPGIKMGTHPQSPHLHEELFAPILTLIPYADFSQAIELANNSNYGLTASLQSLDEREQELFSQHIQVGNTYINRPSTGAMVERQSFGGYKNSSFGYGHKAGGPDYLLSFMEATDTPSKLSPLTTHPPHDITFDELFTTIDLDKDSIAQLHLSLESYQQAKNKYFNTVHDKQKIHGQKNELIYRPLNEVRLYIQDSDSKLEVYQVLCALKISEVKNVQLFANSSTVNAMRLNALASTFDFHLHPWSNDRATKFLTLPKFAARVRCLSSVPDAWRKRWHQQFLCIHSAPALSNGRIELLNYHYSQSLSHDYHRYGHVSEVRGAL